MIEEAFERQSNAADWRPDAFEIIGDDNLPLWATKPSDIVVTLTIGRARSCSADSSSFLKRFVSTDDPKYVEAFDGGVIAIAVPVTSISDLSPGQYPVFLKIETGGTTDQALIGELPIVQGF